MSQVASEDELQFLSHFSGGEARPNASDVLRHTSILQWMTGNNSCLLMYLTLSFVALQQRSVCTWTCTGERTTRNWQSNMVVGIFKSGDQCSHRIVCTLEILLQSSETCFNPWFTLCGVGFMLQHGNNPIHTSKLCKKTLGNQGDLTPAWISLT